jgi:cell division septation protein DedD
MRPPLLALLLCCSYAIAGCGGVLHLSKSLSAKRAVERARAANAQDRAPYHLALAEAYLAQAEVEMAGAHGQEAVAYDDLALDHALKAETLARGGKLEATDAGPSPASTPGSGPAAPKKKSSSDQEDL